MNETFEFACVRFGVDVCAGWTLHIFHSEVIFASNWKQDVCLFVFSQAVTHFFVVRAQVVLSLPD